MNDPYVQANRLATEITMSINTVNNGGYSQHIWLTSNGYLYHHSRKMLSYCTLSSVNELLAKSGLRIVHCGEDCVIVEPTIEVTKILHDGALRMNGLLTATSDQVPTRSHSAGATPAAVPAVAMPAAAATPAAAMPTTAATPAAAVHVPASKSKMLETLLTLGGAARINARVKVSVNDVGITCVGKMCAETKPENGVSKVDVTVGYSSSQTGSAKSLNLENTLGLTFPIEIIQT